MRTLNIEPVSFESFACFGDVIEASEQAHHFPINAGTTERYHDLMKIEVDEAGYPIVSIFRGLPRELPFEITMMERHPLGSQAFIPLQNHYYLVAVASTRNAPSIDDIRVFIFQGHQGVNYHLGIWHHPLMALGKTSDFLVIDRAGPGNNCEEHVLKESGMIDSIESRFLI